MQKKINTTANTKYLFLKYFVFSFLVVKFLFFHSGVAEAVDVGGGIGQVALSSLGSIAGYIGGGIVNIVVQGFEWLLYGLLLILVQFVQVGSSVFAWATRPEFISGPTGLLNLESVYTLWKFIRDFFNLFFIFLLLFSAFATVFQIEQYGLRKNFPKIILAAIAINFSFPITRLLIDLGNVPMYFFAEGIVSVGTANGEKSLLAIPNALWQSTNMGVILADIKPGQGNMLVPLISTIIFAFIYMITLVTLAFLFLLRLLKLIILLIISPVGFAASIIPGLKQFGDKWQKELLQTIFWGPAAMFMIVVALRFSLEIQGSNFASGLSATAPAASSESQSSILTQAIFFIPVILMWMALSVAKSSGIQGANFVTSRADKAVAWGQRKALGVAKYPWTNAHVRGIRQGMNKRAYEGRLFGDTIEKATGGYLGAKAWKEGGQDTEAKMKGFIDKGKKGADLERRKAENRRISEKMKEFKDDLLDRDALESKLDSSNEVDRKASALLLAESKEGIKKKPEVLEKALKEFSDINDYEKFEKVLKAADDDAIGMDQEQFKAIIENDKILAMYAKAKGKANLNEAKKSLIIDFGKQMKKVGGDIDKLFEYQTGKYFNPTQPGQQKITRVEVEQLYDDHKLTTKDLSQQSTLLRNTDFQNFAKQNFTASEANELAKFVVQNNKNSDVRIIVEDIKDTVSVRNGNARPAGNPQQTQGQGGGANQQGPAQQWQQNQANRNARSQQARANKARPVNNP